MSSNFKSRDFIIKSTDNYKYKNTCVFTSIKIKRVKFVKKIFMVINEVEISPTEITKNYWIWNVKSLREYIDNLDPESDYDVLLKRLEATFVYNGLKSISFYSNVSNEELASSIFTMDLNINFKLLLEGTANKPKQLDVIEQYYQSDIHSSQ
jgi:hypothetical protein